MRIDVGFAGLLLLAFIVLKLAGVIRFSWFWVLSPAWIPLSIFLSFTVIALICAVIVRGYDRG